MWPNSTIIDCFVLNRSVQKTYLSQWQIVAAHAFFFPGTPTHVGHICSLTLTQLPPDPVIEFRGFW